MKLWNDFDRRLSAKPSHGGQQVDQRTLCGRRLWAAAGYYGSPTAKMASRWFGNEAKKKKSFKICFQMNLQSLFISYNLTDCAWIRIQSVWAIRKHRWRKKSPGSWDDFPGTIYRLTGCKHRTKISITLVIGFSWFLSALFKWWEMLLQTYMTISRICSVVLFSHVTFFLIKVEYGFWSRQSVEAIPGVAVFDRFYQDSGPRFNIKISSCRYRKSHCGDKIILSPQWDFLYW